MRQRPSRNYNDNCIDKYIYCCLPIICMTECIYKFCSIFTCCSRHHESSHSKVKPYNNK